MGPNQTSGLRKNDLQLEGEGDRHHFSSSQMLYGSVLHRDPHINIAPPYKASTNYPHFVDEETEA